MARVNVSVPDELRGEMDGIDGVNWSALAADAWRRVVEQHRRVDETDEAGIVARLRAGYAETADLDRDDGHACGVTWAATTASYRELEQLWVWGDDAPARLARWDVEGSTFEWDAPEAFWEEAGGLTGTPGIGWVEGFVAGAMAVYTRVRDRVRTGA